MPKAKKESAKVSTAKAATKVAPSQTHPKSKHVEEVVVLEENVTKAKRAWELDDDDTSKSTTATKKKKSSGKEAKDTKKTKEAKDTKKTKETKDTKKNKKTKDKTGNNFNLTRRKTSFIKTQNSLPDNFDTQANHDDEMELDEHKKQLESDNERKLQLSKRPWLAFREIKSTDQEAIKSSTVFNLRLVRPADYVPITMEDMNRREASKVAKKDKKGVTESKQENKIHENAKRLRLDDENKKMKTKRDKEIQTYLKMQNNLGSNGEVVAISGRNGAIYIYSL